MSDTPPLPTLPDTDNDTAPTDLDRTRAHTPVTPPPMRPPQAIPPTRGGQIVPPTGQARRASTTNLPRAVPPPARRRPQDSAFYLPWWSLVLMLMVVLAIVFGIVAFVLVLGGREPVLETTPIIRIITAQPTSPSGILQATDVPPLNPIGGQNPPPQFALEGPTLAPVLFTPTAAPILVGSQVVVRGVGANELNVRDAAGVQGTQILFRSPDGTRFLVVDGPLQADGFTWWRIQDPTNPARAGWAVANFLSVSSGE